MKKMVLTGLLMCGLSFSASVALAGPVADATKVSLMEARENLVALVSTPDKEGQTKRLEAIALATAKVDTLIDKNVDALKSFKEVWTAFKTTRDTELIPNILAGKKEEAKALASGIQAGRLKKMQEILGAMAQ